jgi:hypothetical protein
MVRVSLLLWIHTLTHGYMVALCYCLSILWLLPCRCEYCCVQWLETETMKMMRFEFKPQKQFGSRIRIYKKEDLNVKHTWKRCSPSPCGSCVPPRCRMPGDTSDMCRCDESILCDEGNALQPRSGVLFARSVVSSLFWSIELDYFPILFGFLWYYFMFGWLWIYCTLSQEFVRPHFIWGL